MHSGKGKNETRLSMLVNKLHFPVTTLGFGQRVGIWTQGCSIRCPGCISRDTWHLQPRYSISVSSLLDQINPWLCRADGVTISGGEPFDQARALASLVSLLKAGFSGDVLVYSGYSHKKLLVEFPGILRLVDVLISEPFEVSAAQTLTLRGSDNQRIFLLSDLARARYPSDIDHQFWDRNRRLDVVVEGDEVWMAGIPRAGDMARLREELAHRGFAARGSDEPQPLIRA